ncbi:anthranilate synthase component [Raphidocelis subcapitata]|uniref:anthranilate synthase n=1 Tax=Raphidocelis subcapitata TaxID=307507 RepID=A0A2V0PD29_9CHLO|nr:anthranilate synthase component [Raphidocelis subcapitata]|eukprot:GBF95005.1 anthranilate synthase component [Raphidocelis subcapitata]
MQCLRQQGSGQLGRAAGQRPAAAPRLSLPCSAPGARGGRRASSSRGSLATRGLAESPAAPASSQARSPSSAAGAVATGPDAEFESFCAASAAGANVVPLYRRLLSDQLTPVTVYRCLVKENDVNAPSFLLESVVNGDQTGRYSFVGAMPALEVVATQSRVTVLNHAAGTRRVTEEEDPLDVPVQLSRNWRPAQVEGLPAVFTGGWVGYAGYDTVRYVYGGKIPFESSPHDDRQLPDLHLALYNDVVVIDQATKLIYAISWVHLDGDAAVPASPAAAAASPPAGARDRAALRAAYDAGRARLDHLVSLLQTPPPPLAQGLVDLSLAQLPASPGRSNMTEGGFLGAIARAKEYILSGDIFQLVLSQRFERRTFAQPFEVYRALRVVNPSPYMVYMQARGCVIVSSSPEILCRVDGTRVVTNRPLAGTRRRGADAAADAALEEELLADAKERAEHVMLVDLGRNDVGKVCESGSVVVEKLMEVERYSHVMHISSTVTGKLQRGLDCWDALRAALPAGTVSGAPKVRAMQIIDELEVNRRGPYGGGVGHVSFTGAMDMALGLRTMVIPSAAVDTMYSYNGADSRREWAVHIQAGAGLVADSVPEKEYEETINKAAALGRAVDLAEQAFVRAQGH